MKQLSFTALLLMSSVCFGQTVVYNDLIKILSLDTDEVKAFLVKKGFDFNGSRPYSKGDVAFTSFDFDSKDGKSAVIFQVPEYYAKGGRVSILFETTDSVQYQNIKAISKRNGHVKGTMFNNSDYSCTDYSNKTIAMTFCTKNEGRSGYKILVNKRN